MRSDILSFLGLGEFYKSISESDAGVATIAIWFVDRSSAAAQCHPISNLIGGTIMRFHSDSPLNVKWAADTECGVFHNAYRRLKIGFDLLSCLLLV